jgi:hypothetical protein
MKRLLALAAAPLLFAAGCSSSSGTPTAAPTTTVTATAPAASPGATTGTATATATTPTTATGTATGAATGAGPGTGVATKPASAPRCHTGDLKVSVGAGDGAAGTTYAPLIFKNASGHACTLSGFPGVSWVAGTDRHQVNAPFARTDGTNGAITLAVGGAAHATLATHDVGFYDAAQCRPVSVLGYRVYPPDETRSIFVPQATKACSVNGVNQGMVAAVARGVAP